MDNQVPCISCKELIRDLKHEDDADFGYCYACFERISEERKQTAIKQELVASARSFDQEQMLRSKEFEIAYQKFLAGDRRPLEPVTWAWLRERMAPKFNGCTLPGRILPHLFFGDKWADHPGYVAIERRMVLTNTAFGEIYAAGDKTPKRNMVQIQ